MISKKHEAGLKQFQETILSIREYLTGDWIQRILKKKKLSKDKYIKKYNMLVNWRAGRSYRATLKNKDLYNEMIELANKYKNLEL